MSRDSFGGASSLVGDCCGGLQLFKTSLCGDSDFFRFELPRRTFIEDFLDGAGEAAVTIMSIFASCCSSSPDCSMHVARILADPVGETFREFDSLYGLRSPLFITDERSRKILSSRAFNDPRTDGGVK